MNERFKKTLFYAALVLFITIFQACKPQQEKFSEEYRSKLVSPDGKLEAIVSLNRSQTGSTSLQYQVNYLDKEVVLPSKMELIVDNYLWEVALALDTTGHTDWFSDLELVSVNERQIRETWEPVYGERSLIHDHYNEVVLEFVKANGPDYEIQLILRAYDEGFAFRFHFPEHPDAVYYQILEENTEFAMPSGTLAYFTYHAQGPYTLRPLNDWPREAERPLTLKLKNGLYACLTEAAMIDYVRSMFRLSEDKPNTIQTAMYSTVDAITPFNTPWRVVMVAEQPGQLLENNDIVLNLNPPNRIEDTSWIKPGKIMREVTQKTENALKIIDFAVEQNLQYILFDWLWYGWAYSFETDASTVEADLDMQKIIDYGKERGIGVWVYVNQHALLHQIDRIFPIYKEWGLVGIKFGFVQVGSHRWTTWMQEAVRKAAENQLMVNIHDEYRPTGFSRTYPNLVTQEGIRGNEEFPDATHNTILPFTRMIAGAGDYTICYYDNRLVTTHAHQLALSMIMYSPLQVLFWYDRPSQYEGEPEVEFFRELPTVWDESIVPQAEIGEYVVMARRSKEDWFMGIITNNDARSMEISFDFLPEGKNFAASFYVDDPSVPTKTQVGIERRNISNGDSVTFDLLPSGGAAIWLKAI